MSLNLRFPGKRVLGSPFGDGPHKRVEVKLPKLTIIVDFFAIELEKMDVILEM